MGSRTAPPKTTELRYFVSTKDLTQCVRSFGPTGQISSARPVCRPDLVHGPNPAVQGQPSWGPIPLHRAWKVGDEGRVAVLTATAHPLPSFWTHESPTSQMTCLHKPDLACRLGG